MRAAVLYESLTGNTRRASEIVVEELRRQGIEAAAFPVTNVDHQWLSGAELVLVGGWVDGLFFVGQRPGRRGRMNKVPALAGKQAVVFCTYALDPGTVLDQLTELVERRGATVLGGLAIHRRRLAEGARSLAEQVVALTAAAR